MALYDTVRDLPLVVERYELEGHEYVVGPTFTRKTTVIRLDGAGEEGLGEDVTYDAAEQDAQQKRGPVLALAGEWTIDSFSRISSRCPCSSSRQSARSYVDYRRWAFESAALDLALRQAGLSLGGAVGREPRPGDVRRVRRASATHPRLRGSAPSSTSTPRSASSSTPDRTGRTGSSTSCDGSGASTRVDLKGAVQRDGRRQPARPGALPPGARGVPGGVDRGPGADPRDDPAPRAARRPRHLGRRDPLRRRHRRAPLAAADRQRQAVALRLDRAPVRRVRALRGARHRRATAAASGSSDRDAATSSCWPRCSTRTRRTTSPRSATTRTEPVPGLPTSPLAVTARTTGFLAEDVALDRASVASREAIGHRRRASTRKGRRCEHRSQTCSGTPSPRRRPRTRRGSHGGRCCAGPASERSGSTALGRLAPAARAASSPRDRRRRGRPCRPDVRLSPAPGGVRGAGPRGVRSCRRPMLDAPWRVRGRADRRARWRADRPGPQRDPQPRPGARPPARQPPARRGERHRAARPLRRRAVHVRRDHRRHQAGLEGDPRRRLGGELSDARSTASRSAATSSTACRSSTGSKSRSQAGSRSRLGRLLDVAYNIEYGAETSATRAP